MVNKHGGKRKGAGRKEIKDKKEQLSIYPRKSIIRMAGGKKKAKELALNSLLYAAKNSLKIS